MAAASIRLRGNFAGTPGPMRQSFQADLYDNDRATKQTVEAMAQHIKSCASDPYIRWAAQDALKTWGNSPVRIGGPGAPVQTGDQRSRAAWAVWWWVKSNLKFAQDDEQLLKLLNESDQLELLITPSVMVRLESRAGDCDDYTMLVCCLLEALGVPWRIQTVAVDPGEPLRWSHVYAGAILSDGSLVSLDASHGKFPGWQIPRDRVYRLQVWDENGTPAGGEQSMYQMGTGVSGVRGLHGYTRGLGAPVRPVVPIRQRVVMRRRGMRGLGACGDCLEYDDSGNCINTDVTGCTTPADQQAAAAQQNANATPIGSTPVSTSSSSSSSNNALDTALANLASAWTRIAGQTIAPQTTITGPGGYSVTGPSSAIASTALPALNIGGLTGNNLLLIGIIGIGAFILFTAVKK